MIMGKRSLEKATGLSEEQRIAQAKSGLRKNLNNTSNPKPMKHQPIIIGPRRQQLSEIPLDLQNLLLDSIGKH